MVSTHFHWTNSNSSGTSDTGPPQKGTTSLQRTLFWTPFPTFLTSEKRTTSQQRTKWLITTCPLFRGSTVLHVKTPCYIFYLAGPFIISCNDEEIFLKVTPNYRVVGTSKIEESSEFLISEEDDRGYKFSVMYVTPSRLGKEIKPIARYLYTPVNFLGKSSGPLELRLNAKDSKTQLTLHSRRVRNLRPVKTKDWVSSVDIFYLNCKQRAIKKNSYICVKQTPQGCDVDAEYITCCAPSIKEHELEDTFMLFRLIQAGQKDPDKRNKNAGDNANANGVGGGGGGGGGGSGAETDGAADGGGGGGSGN